MYEGDSNAPKERFVTMQELEDSGIITASIKNKFAFISQIQGVDIMQPAGTSSGSVRKRTAPAVSTATIAAAADPVVATGSVLAGTIDDAMLRWDSTTSAWEEETQLRVTNLGVFSIFDSLLTDSVAFDHDGTDFNTVAVNTTDWNISGITKIQAGGVDADFDALTATSFEGIAAANLLDKSAAETISGAYTITGGLTLTTNPLIAGTIDADFDALTATSFGGITSANLLDKSATEVVTGGWTFQGGVIRFDRTQPHVQWWESDAALDEKLWSLRTNAGSLFIEARPDDNSASFPLLEARRTGTAIDLVILKGTTVQVDNALTATSFGGIASANLLDKSATETVSGAWTFTATENIRLDNSRPRLWFTETDATADEGVWRFTATGDTFRLQAFDDAESASSEAFQVTRAAHVITGFDFKVPVTIGDGNSADGEVLLKFDIDRAWQFEVNGEGATTTLDLKALAAGKTFNIRDSADKIQHRFITGSAPSFSVLDASGVDSAKFAHDGTDFNTTFVNTTDWNVTVGTFKIFGNLQMSDNLVLRPEIRDYSLAKHNETSSSGTLSINMSLGNAVRYTFTENVTTVTITNPPVSGTFGEIWLKLVQHASSPKTIAWASKYNFPGGVDHVMSTGVGDIDLVHLVTIDGGARWECTFVQDMS